MRKGFVRYHNVFEWIHSGQQFVGVGWSSRASRDLFRGDPHHLVRLVARLTVTHKGGPGWPSPITPRPRT